MTVQLKAHLRFLKGYLSGGKFSFWLFLLVIFTLPISRYIFTITLWPWFLSWLLEGNFREKFSRTNLKNNYSAIILLPVIFLLLLISLIWSSGKTEGMSQLGIMATIVIFPLLIGFSRINFSERGNLKFILISFISGVMCAITILLARALIYSISIKSGNFTFDPIINEWENVFFSTAFSILIHPTYFGMMVLMAASVVFLDIFSNYLLAGRTGLKIFLLMIFLPIIFLISARSVIVACLVIVIIVSYKKIFTGKYALIPSIIIFLIIGYFMTFNPRVSNLLGNLKSFQNEHIDSIDQRVIIWKSTAHLIKENLFLGVGIGDIQNELEKEYKRYGVEFPMFYNCHNQFAEFWLSGGIIVVLLLIAALIIPLFNRNTHLFDIYLTFLVLTVVVFIFESALSRFWGVAFFSIFYTLLTQRSIREK